MIQFQIEKTKGGIMHPKSLLTIDSLNKLDIIKILNDAYAFSSQYKDWLLKSPALVANLFFENSTRTHFSFASAEHQLGLKVEDYYPDFSSLTKGESLYDTCKTFQSIGYKLLVIRNKEDNYFDQLNSLTIPIINAGDGKQNHPTQCLLDLYTIIEHFHRLHGLKIAIIGDIYHSRVANSNYQALKMFGNEVVFSGPEEFKREGFPYENIDTAIKTADVVMLLRIQFERLNLPMQISKQEYHEKFGLTKKRYEMMKENAIILHPAPVNRGLEIDSDLVEAPKSRIFKQMENGVLVRKAVIKRALQDDEFNCINKEWDF